MLRFHKDVDDDDDDRVKDDPVDARAVRDEEVPGKDEFRGNGRGTREKKGKKNICMSNKCS